MDGSCEEQTTKKLSKQGQSRSGRWPSTMAPQLLSRSYSAGSTSIGATCRDVDGLPTRRQEEFEEEEEEEERRGRGGEGAGARLSRKVKEQRARFYIMRRCIHMLVCWRDDTHC